MNKHSSLALSTLSGLLLCACASQGPVVPMPPCVRVSQLDSIFISPEVVKFQAKVVIDNQMGAGLEIEKVDYGAEVHDNSVFTETFRQLHPMRSRGQQTVTFPFQIAMKDITDRAVDVLAEEALRISFGGAVYPVGFDPVPFRATKSIPLPSLPLITFGGAQGSPFGGGSFGVTLRVKNANKFPLCVRSVDSYLDVNGKKYCMLRSANAADVPPGGTGKILLAMENSVGKGLSMVLNVAQARSARMAVGGSLSFGTPYGLVYLPLNLSLDGTAAE